MIKSIASRTLRAYGQVPVYNVGIKKWIYDQLYWDDESYVGTRILNASPFVKSEHIVVHDATSHTPKVNVTTLSSGITVLTESPVVPSTVQLGILIRTGTRNETNENSGALLSIKNTYMKTVLNTNETVNYGVHQMSGGKFEMDYCRENTYFKASCLAHDVVDLFSILFDCAFEPRSVVAANVGIYKNNETHKLDAQLGGNQAFNDGIFSLAYGNKGLGMPLYGHKNNVSNLTAHVLQNFQLTNYTPDRVVICASGVENHQEFVDLVGYKLSKTSVPYRPRKAQGESEQVAYTGGEIRNNTDSGELHAAFAFKGDGWKSSAPYLIARNILGHNRQRGRLHKNVLSKNQYIKAAEPFKYSFSDAGIFGVKFTGSAAKGGDVIKAAIDELKSLANVTEEEIASAKNLVKIQYHAALQDPAVRLEELAKVYSNMGTTSLKFEEAIDNVTGSQIEEAVKAGLKEQPSIVLQGANVKSLPSFDKLANLLK